MHTLNIELYEALIDAGASDDKAKKAAEVFAAQQTVTKEDVGLVRNDVKRLNYLITGLYISGAVVVGYFVNLLNTIIGKF